jgi:hypothetical protein
MTITHITPRQIGSERGSLLTPELVGKRPARLGMHVSKFLFAASAVRRHSRSDSAGSNSLIIRKNLQKS